MELPIQEVFTSFKEYIKIMVYSIRTFKTLKKFVKIKVYLIIAFIDSIKVYRY